MFLKLIAKALSHSDTAVKRGAKDAQKGKRSIPVDAFAQRGRDQKQKGKK